MTRSQKHNSKKYCCEPLELVENYKQAEADDFRGWCIHHRLEIQPDGTRVSAKELKDKGLYFGRPASELVFMRFGDHITLHNTGKHLSDETRQKLSEALSDENHPFFGKHHSEESRRKMSEALKGKTFSEEHRQKIAEAHKGENNPLFGKHHSEETRLKMSEAIKGKNHPFFGKTLSNEHRQKIAEAAKGKHWWNNGVSCKFSRECPGEGWTRGRLRFK